MKRACVYHNGEHETTEFYPQPLSRDGLSFSCRAALSQYRAALDMPELTPFDPDSPLPERKRGVKVGRRPGGPRKSLDEPCRHGHIGRWTRYKNKKTGSTGRVCLECVSVRMKARKKAVA
jgi:hypothetical protein